MEGVDTITHMRSKGVSNATARPVKRVSRLTMVHLHDEYKSSDRKTNIRTA